MNRKLNSRNLVQRIWPAMAVLVCALVAWSATLVNWQPSTREVVPFAVLALVLVLGMIFGRSVGILGSIIAALVFAHSLYEPLGSLRVESQGARSGLAWMLLAGVAFSYLLLPTHGNRSNRGH